MAGPQGSCLQRGKDTYCFPRRRLRLLGVQRPSLPRQAVDQTEYGGFATGPETACRGGKGSPWIQRRCGDQYPQPDHSGLVGLLPNGLAFSLLGVGGSGSGGGG